jgi:hypothetical protein
LSIAFAAAGFYDESRRLDPEVSERVADRAKAAAGGLAPPVVVRAEFEAAHADLDTPRAGPPRLPVRGHEVLSGAPGGSRSEAVAPR